MGWMPRERKTGKMLGALELATVVLAGFHFLQAWPRIHSRPPGCRLSDMARTGAGEQRHRAEVFY
jgi:hypothetical protein